jgi:hypothetical protein
MMLRGSRWATESNNVLVGGGEGLYFSYWAKTLGVLEKKLSC